jgi:outer membrane protein OmpA-like peptidoglycan-associated protein
MNSVLRRVAIVAIVALVAACAAPKEQIVLLPNPSGLETAVVVSQGERQVMLAKPYAAARLRRGGPESFASNAQDVQTRYGAALAAQPLPPAQFTLFFVDGKDELTDESRQIVDGVFAEIAKRPIPDVIVIGHTDTVGSDAANDLLSRQRADVVRAGFVARGLATDKVLTVGRGKREPAVATGDGVAEPRNRRVEILVR